MAGIYIHIPFCKQKCSYCDFHFSTRFQDYRNDMISCLVKEMVQQKAALENEIVETIYFGGGTPSILNEHEISQILNAIRQNYTLAPKVEFTLEANPDDMNLDQLSTWKRLGVNRLSVGIQSFKKSDLEWMNRAHTVDDALKCVENAQSAGFNNLTVDLIYGLPDLTMNEWKQHIQHIIDLKVPHISAYCLTVEPKTALSNWVGKGKINLSSEDTQSDQFLSLLELLERNGYEQYEISNFSMPGFKSQHNSNYWNGVKYIGIGPSAHSFDGINRKWNVSNNHNYIKGITNDEKFWEEERLTSKDRFNELLLTGLRTSKGVSLVELESIQTIHHDFELKLAEMIRQKWVDRFQDSIMLTKEGKLRADFIASELFMVN